MVALPVILLAQETNLLLPGGDMLSVQGDEFIFEQAYEEIEGELVLRERALWDGNVTASFGDILIETGHIEALFDGEQVSRLEAGPEVIVTGMDGKARFECHDMVIDFPKSEEEVGVYSGVCTDVRGSYIVSPADFGYGISETYEVNFTADIMWLGTDSAILKRPCLSLGDLDNPDLAFDSREINFDVGTHPLTGNREILRAATSNVSVTIFGNRINLVPFPLRRSFLRITEPGFTFPLPEIGVEKDAGFHIAQSVAYDFVLDTFEVGPQLIFELDLFPWDRSYPELRLEGDLGDYSGEIRTGYRREENWDGYTVPTRAEPEITIRRDMAQVGDSRFGFQLSGFWGHLRDMTTGTDLDRWGYSAIIEHSGIRFDDFSLTGSLAYLDKFYERGHNYATLESGLRLRYMDSPNWGVTLTYSYLSDWGRTPFRFDIPGVREVIGLRQQTRISRRWGAGIDWAWDLIKDDFEHQEYHMTYILDSFQVSLGWDTRDKTASIFFGLPGSLK